MSTRFFDARRPLFAGLAAIAVVVSLLAFPAVRVAADQLLNVFRMQKVVFLPIDPDRVEQLHNLNFDAKTLFVAEPRIVNNPAEPRSVSTADIASTVVGFTIGQPSTLPSAPASAEFIVHDHTIAEFQVNVESSRELLALMEINDVTIPDALGAAPIIADMPSFVESRYHGDGYDLTLFQARSPSITLPDGVDMAQLGKATLRLIGMDPQQAETLSRQIDWNSTFVFPFPTNVSNILQVSVGGSDGVLMSVRGDHQREWRLYWQRGDYMYMLESQGRLRDADVIAAAESVR